MAQSRRISSTFISHRWREHPVMSEVINYHLFNVMVPLVAHKKLKYEVATLARLVKEKQSELSRLSEK